MQAGRFVLIILVLTVVTVAVVVYNRTAGNDAPYLQFKLYSDVLRSKTLLPNDTTETLLDIATNGNYYFTHRSKATVKGTFAVSDSVFILSPALPGLGIEKLRIHTDTNGMFMTAPDSTIFYAPLDTAMLARFDVGQKTRVYK